MDNPRVLVIGIDGLPYSLLNQLADNGVIPNLKSLLQGGESKLILSSIPDVSSTAWTGFMTGTNPGTHGIYGFFDPGNEYNLEFTNFTHIRAEPLWKKLARTGKRSLIVNIPQTYPAQPLNGALVSGFVAPDFNKSVYPSGYIKELQQLGYTIDVDAWLARTDPQQFFEDLFGVLEKRLRGIRHLWEKDNWDFMTVVFTGTDRLQHYFWDAIGDRSHRFHQIVLDYYREVDRTVGKVLELADDQWIKIVLSDHGFTGVIREVNLNAWLRQAGLLKFLASDPESLQEMDDSSLVFSVDPGRIYLNRADRFSRGWIQPGEEFERRRDEIKTMLESEIKVRDDVGDPVNPVDRVVYPEEIYSGPHTDKAPDLVVLPTPGFDLKGSVKITEVARNDALTGVHTREDASLIVSNPSPGFAFSEIRNIQDLAPQILRCYGVEG